MFNDLKPDNLIASLDNSVKLSKSSNHLARLNVNLIDFGFATQYAVRVEESRQMKHIKKHQVKTFRGNMIFSSHNQLCFDSTSRKDDMISLCYLLVYLVRGGSLPHFVEKKGRSYRDLFKEIENVKASYTVEDLCSKE